jgi:hypothetical protein
MDRVTAQRPLLAVSPSPTFLSSACMRRDSAGPRTHGKLTESVQLAVRSFRVEDPIRAAYSSCIHADS